MRPAGGIVDLLLETDEGVVIVDHKSFPRATEASWRGPAGCGPALRVRAHALPGLPKGARPAGAPASGAA